MHPSRILLITLLSSPWSLPLLAQQPTKAATPPDVKTAPADAVRPGLVTTAATRREPDAAALPLPALPDRVMHDITDDGVLWARGRSWKAACDGDRITFVPFFGSQAQRNWPLQMSLSSVVVDGQPLAVDVEQTARDGDRWQVRRVACNEQFVLRPDGVEQTWTFAQLPARGALRLRMAITTDLTAEDLGADLVFRGPEGSIGYGGAVAIDARGRRCALELDVRDGAVELVVPAAFVADAELPLLVDPVFSSLLISATQAYQGNASIAFDYDSQQFLTVWENAFSATDLDVYAQRLDAAMAAIGVPFTVDVTGVSWARPRVANNGVGDNFLVVAECSFAFASPRWIGGRIVTMSSMLGQFDIERTGFGGSASGDALRPDVGGDPAETGTTWYTVVWEREFSTADHDILMRQVSPSGALRTFASVVIDASLGYESMPRIAKSNGYDYGGNPAVQYWPVVYQRTYSPGDEDVRGSLISADGVFLGSATFPIATSSRDERQPVVSSPTDLTGGARRHAVAYTRLEPTTSTDVMLTICDAGGAVLTTSNLQTAEGAGAAAAWPQVAPCIDSDGVRFTIAYKELWSGIGGDFDVRVSTFAHDPVSGATAVHDSRQTLAGSALYEGGPAIASMWSASGSAVHHGIVWQQYTPVGPTHNVYGALYRGHVPGPLPTVRATACGGLGISMTGLPALGLQFHLTQSDSGPLSGFVVGTPVSVPLPFCAGCTVGVDGPLLQNPFSLVIPPSPTLVGMQLAAQAWSLYTGTCLGSIALSDTIDFTLL